MLDRQKAITKEYNDGDFNMWFSWLPYDSFSLDAIAFVVGTAALLVVWKIRQRFSIVWAVIAYLGLMVMACTIQRVYLDTDTFGSIFGLMRMMSWFLFFFGPVAFVIVAKFEDIAWQKNSLIGTGLLLLFVGMDAFVLEPNMLDINRVEIKHQKIKKRTRIVLLADIQTDELNRHTRRALKEAIEQKPDAIFFAGDYLQFSFIREFPAHIKPFNQLLKDYGYDKVPLFVVEGDVEDKLDHRWHQLFAGLPATIFKRSGRKVWNELEIIGLTMVDSKEGLVPQVKNNKLFSIVLGHNPNFSLSKPKAELYLAGHTHGGQVQIPFIGPLITLSDIPRHQAHGRTDFEHGSTMLVSRGIGLERYDAPRLRFFCRPEIVVIDLLPETQ